MRDGHHDAPPQVAVLSAHDDRYQVRGALEIASLLRALVARHALVTAHAGASFFVTALLEVDDDAGRLVFDYGVDAAETERLLQAPALTFVTQLDHVRIQFAVQGMERIDYEGSPVFTTPVPDRLTRLQRREFYRLRIPRGRPLACEFAIPPAADGDPPGRRLSLPVFDLSCGGASLYGWPDDFAPRPAMKLAGATIPLPDLGAIVADLHVVHVQGAGGRGGTAAGRFGCRFDALQPGGVTLIQRYINRIEREQKALL